MELFKPVQYIVNISKGIDLAPPMNSLPKIIPNGNRIPLEFIDNASQETLKNIERFWINSHILKGIYFKTLNDYMNFTYTEAARIAVKPPNNNSAIMSKEESEYVYCLEIGRFARALRHITALQSIESLKLLINTTRNVLVENFGKLDPERARPDKIRDFLDDCDMFLSFRETTILDHKLLGIMPKPLENFNPIFMVASTIA